MIIWSGFGLLSILAGIAGLIAGFGMSVVLAIVTGSNDLGTAAVLISTPVIAAALNWGLYKLVAREKAGVAPAPGAHSLFFIPMKWWSAIYLALLLPAMIITAVGLGMKSDDPIAEKEFDAANALIDTHGEATAHGNTDKAREATVSFADLMKGMKDLGFDGGTGADFSTKGKFLTYCRVNEDSVIFLCHVPELRKYKDEAEEALAQLGWSLARKSILSHFPDLPPETKLAIGLRGFALYGPVWEGQLGDEEPTTKPDERESLYKHFAAPAEAPENTL